MGDNIERNEWLDNLQVGDTVIISNLPENPNTFTPGHSLHNDPDIIYMEKSIDQIIDDEYIIIDSCLYDKCNGRLITSRDVSERYNVDMSDAKIYPVGGELSKFAWRHSFINDINTLNWDLIPDDVISQIISLINRGIEGSRNDID